MTYTEALNYILGGIGLMALLVLVSMIVAAFLAPIIDDEDDTFGPTGFSRRRANDSFDVEHGD